MRARVSNSLERPAHATHNWTTKELLEHARVFPALLESIEKVSGPIDEGTACRLGQLLRHGVGEDIDDLTVVRVEGSKGRGVLWAVRPFDIDKPSKRSRGECRAQMQNGRPTRARAVQFARYLDSLEQNERRGHSAQIDFAAPVPQ